MKSNLLGFKLEGEGIFSLERPSFPPPSKQTYIVVRIFGEQKYLNILRQQIKYREFFLYDVLASLHLQYREI